MVHCLGLLREAMQCSQSQVGTEWLFIKDGAEMSEKPHGGQEDSKQQASRRQVTDDKGYRALQDLMGYVPGPDPKYLAYTSARPHTKTPHGFARPHSE